ncbi:MAG: cation:proton antiporter [Desulfobacterium sp.]|jgi:Kef-type K+ transport system membrane component KefB|nr:cation:proton antiporter [Desulfobacterium sp.]
MIIHSAWALVLVSVGAAFLPSLGRRLRLPSVVLEILFGVFIGKSLLNLQFGEDWLSFMAHLGFLILMFHAGMEINFQMLKKQRAGMFGIQAGVFLATVLLSMGAAFILDQGFYLGLVLSTTSLGLVVPTLSDTGASQSPLGQNALIAATLADFLTLFAITFFLLWHQNGFGWDFLRPLPLFIGFGILLKLVKFLAWWYPEKTGRLLADRDSQELGVRFSMALLFLFVALSEMAHLEPVLGAFLGGALLSIVFREKAQLEMKLSGFGYGFLVPLFFIHVGMQFDVANVLNLEQLLFTAKLLGFAVAVKVLPSLLFMLSGVSFLNSLNIGLLMTSRLSLIIVAATIGLEFGFITEAFKDAIILLAIITCLMGPTMFKAFYRTEKETTDSGTRIEKSRLTAGWMQQSK